MSANAGLSARISEALTRGDTAAALRLMRKGSEDAEGDAVAGAGQARQVQDGGVQQAVQDALQSGNPIDAIRKFRAANPGMDLRDAKLAVEALRHQAGVAAAHAGAESLVLRARAERTPTVQEGDHGGYAVVLLAVIAAAGALAWWWLGSP